LLNGKMFHGRCGRGLLIVGIDKIDHDFQMTANEKKLLFSIILVAIILTAKLIGSYLTKSLALRSDSWHLATDLASLIISWAGLKIATREANIRFTFGYYRFSILSALINNLSLIGISFVILFQTITRYLHPVRVEPGGMVLFSILGLVINLIIIFKLRDGQKNINVKSVFLHFMGDTLADLGVLIGGLLIKYTGWYRIDTGLSALLACFILRNAMTMTQECVKVLLEAVPGNISILKIKESLKKIPGVKEVTDLHIWSLSLENIVLTAHICVLPTSINVSNEIIHQIQQVLLERFSIVHSTIQVESDPCGSSFHSRPDHLQKCILCIDSSGFLKE
jgi:cobalt-zinc-cadmium efflux system protein